MIIDYVKQQLEQYNYEYESNECFMCKIRI